MASFPGFFERLAITVQGRPARGRAADWANNPDDAYVPPSVEVVYDPLDRSAREMPEARVDRRLRLGSVEHRPDAIARYVPWHLRPDEWGIYFQERVFWQYAQDLHDVARRRASGTKGPRLSTVARVAFESVLEHELTHFESEVLGTQIEALLGNPAYTTYLNDHYREATPFGAPIEEALATAREVKHARSHRRATAVIQAIEASADSAPPGYSDWRSVIDPRDEQTAIARLQSLMSRQLLTAPFGLGATPEERQQVPIRWAPDDIDRPLLPPGVSKQSGITTIKRFEAWLRHVGLETRTRSSGGDHIDIWDPVADRRVSGYDSVGGRKSRELYDPQPSRIARDLGYSSRGELLEAIRNMSPRPVTGATQVRP